MEAQASFKIVLVGSSRGGKSSILERFTRNEFSDASAETYGVEYATKRVVVNDDVLVDLNIWDTAGAPKYRAITTAYYTSASGVLLVYDSTSLSSFEACSAWLAEVRTHTDAGIPVVLVGNKIDLAEDDSCRAVSQDAGRNFAEEYDLGFVECSALTGFGVPDAFSLVAEAAWQRLVESEHSRRLAEEQAERERAASVAVEGGSARGDGVYETPPRRGRGSPEQAKVSGAGLLSESAGPRGRRGVCCFCCCWCCCIADDGGAEAEGAALLVNSKGPPSAQKQQPRSASRDRPSGTPSPAAAKRSGSATSLRSARA